MKSRHAIWWIILGIMVFLLCIGCDKTLLTVSSNDSLATPTVPITITTIPTVSGLPPTAVPEEYYNVTARFITPTNEIYVGDTFSITLVVTNTGQLCAYNIKCQRVDGWARLFWDDELWRMFSIIEPISPQEVALPTTQKHCNNDTVTCEYVFQALNPGTALLEWWLYGEVHFPDQVIPVTRALSTIWVRVTSSDIN
jgi:hypothetical protein